MIAFTEVHMREAGSSCRSTHSQASALEPGIPCNRFALLSAASRSQDGSMGSDSVGKNLQERQVREHGYYAAAQCACTTTCRTGRG